MASEEPRQVRYSPQVPSVRLLSAPAASTAATIHSEMDSKPSTPAASGSAANPAAAPHVDSQLSGVAVESNESLPGNKTEPEARDSPVKAEDSFLQDRGFITLDNVRRAAKSTNLVELEACAQEARQVLDLLRQPMAGSNLPELLDWVNRIDKLLAKPQRTRTVVAVAGATGAGKSSLVNALLDEEKILPTSGTRACTAVITEVSYNDSEDPRRAYRAEIEFISLEDWNSELKLLLGDLVEDKNLSKAYLDANAEAGIAYAKIRAVYPDLTHDMIVQSTVDQLASRDAVMEVLGETRSFAFGTARDLHTTLQKHLDSKKKDTGGAPPKEEEMAFWPLVKVVKVYTRASALKQGICLVDLPGIHDANAARSAVAKKYMANCSAIWVSAPIKRAVDDEAARKLLGMSNRLQMKLDGIFSDITFVCTSTDSVDPEECMENFDDDGEIRATFRKGEQLANAVHEKEEAIRLLQQQFDECTAACDGLDREFEVWSTLQSQQERGQKVYQPQIPAKRKRLSRTSTRRRSQRAVDDGPSEEDTADSCPLTAEAISSKVIEIKNKLSSAEADYEEMEKRLETMQNDLSDTQARKEETDVESMRLCIRKRNDHVKAAIRVDFANGIREIDEAGAQADEDSLDLPVNQRDYDEVGRSLTVFCVSSKAYQQLRRQSKRQTRVEGFKTLMDSEIPLLQQYAMDLPGRRRIQAYKSFLNEFCGLMGSLTIWAGVDPLERSAQQMSKQDRDDEIWFIHHAAKALKEDLETIICDHKKELDTVILRDFKSKCAAATAFASRQIGDIVSKWPRKTDEGGWGIAFATYKATCRRDGGKTKSQRSRDFNEDILEPYVKKIAAGWDQAFGSSVPGSLDNFVTAFTQKLTEFHEAMFSRPQMNVCGLASANMLKQQVENNSVSMGDIVTNMKASIKKEQRQVSRTFYPEIQRGMMKAYARVAGDSGTGCFKRMKGYMSEHVHKNRNAIYRSANARVMKDLGRIIEANRKDLEETAYAIVDILETDFRSVIDGFKSVAAVEVARGHSRGILFEVDARFEALLCAESTEADAVERPEPEPQQLPIAGVTGAGISSRECAAAVPMAEAEGVDAVM